jgi:UDP-N-acetylglucosamine--N-acetylmuramyl-(pentapeptide) pyrophosphoryl-undecaprenol N-acetylglucosamine transferase
VHQTGTADLEQVRAGYADVGLDADVRPFIDDMAAAYHRADLVVCRAGALTVAELTICRRAALLVPFPHAIYNHQELNARTLSDRGAAVLLLDRDLDGATLGRTIAELADHGQAREAMARAAGELGRPHAGDAVVDRCLELIDGSKA